MLQPLLAERFHLKVHTEQRHMPVFQLVLAKGGPRIKQAMQDEISKPGVIDGRDGRIQGVGSELASLPSLLSKEVGRPVVDRTGLTSRYDFTLEYVPAVRAAVDETSGTSIFTAVEEQLGLKLKPARQPMDVLVIDSIVLPARN